jgi:mRNA-degrading endonuclease toxin of MazEF toxin-antitoxin module
MYDDIGPLPVIVVSSDPRNENYEEVLVCSIVPPDVALPPQETVVQLGNAEPIQGFITADWIFPIAITALEHGRNLGSVSREAMMRLDRALAAALGLI